MDLRATLLRAAAARPRVLVTGPAGATAARLAVERELRRRSWPAAAATDETDGLVVYGQPGQELSAAIERVWAQLSPPRARLAVPGCGAAVAILDQLPPTLADPERQRAEARQPPEAPEDLAMAERGPDRDGLALDRLHVALGPVLPDWPAGLTLRLTVQGDLVQEAEARRLDGGRDAGPGYWDEPWRLAASGGGQVDGDGAPAGTPVSCGEAARRLVAGAPAGTPVSCGEAARRLVAGRLDSLGRLLAVAGWDGAALAARRLRDQVLGGVAGTALEPGLRRFRRRVGGSRLLRWMTRDIGRLEPAEVAGFGFVPAPPGRTDVAGRTRWWLDRIGQVSSRLDDPRPLAEQLATADPLAQPPAGPLEPRALSRLAALLIGTELAVARLVVASLDPDLERLPAGAGAGRG